MLPSLLAAVIALTLASFVVADCSFPGGPPRAKNTYSLYLYKSYECTGTVLKHTSIPVDGVCRNLPVATKNKKTGQLTGPNWGGQVKSLYINAPIQAVFKMFKDQNCTNEYGVIAGLGFVSNTTGETSIMNDDQTKIVNVKLEGMSSYLVKSTYSNSADADVLALIQKISNFK
ncbi:hypothetical protein BJ138DRAFT_651570 [Hygrophoropsis aurantiaca]|uniref:Uncharacterized protein n=1 Tax=Hygrophoropsis aurantiaca TaxID=72124 RepID=A0ACB7ZYF1_9AGAM|nr:hypothetical protein BJ138DRAFT_651570 [Hygrophoropsis aurantiaca]